MRTSKSITNVVCTADFSEIINLANSSGLTPHPNFARISHELDKFSANVIFHFTLQVFTAKRVAKFEFKFSIFKFNYSLRRFFLQLILLFRSTCQ